VPYFAVDDGMYDHPKFDGLSDTAVALWTKAGSWCARYLKDGEVPADRVLKLGYTPSVADELVRAGLWTGHRTGFRFHQWERHQFSKADVEKKRERWREEKRRQRGLKSQYKPEMSGTDSGVESGPVSECPIPSHPIPDKRESADAAHPPAVASRKKSESEAVSALKAALARHIPVPPGLSKSLADKAAVRLRDAVKAGVAADLASAADALVSAFKASPRNGNVWALLDVQLAPPAPTRPSCITADGRTTYAW
jgi:hypothetical protein